MPLVRSQMPLLLLLCCNHGQLCPCCVSVGEHSWYPRSSCNMLTEQVRTVNQAPCKQVPPALLTSC